MAPKTLSGKRRSDVWIYLLFVLATSFFTYVYRYNFPQSPFWDEPYHIASAQKYLNGVYFMEQHPPLGKLFIALGEKITGADKQYATRFADTDYAKNMPADASFAGFRLFPTLFGWLTAPLLFLIFLFFSGSGALSALLSFVYIFDNAQIVHARGAMIDSTLVFFSTLMIFVFLHLQRKDKSDIYRHCVLSFLFGAVFGLIMTTKVVGLVLILLFPALFVRLYPDWRRIVLLILTSCIGFIIAYVGVWSIHFALGTRVVPQLPDNGYYQASAEYKDILSKKETSSLSSFPVMLRDSLRFVVHYNKGVPRMDLCKTDENGSLSFFWPFGARTINYRWETPDSNEYRYLYLVPNVVGWGLGLLGVILSTILLVSPLFFQTKEQLQHKYLLAVMLGLYASYMIAISQIHRVMYLYHYFLPLTFSYILFGMVVSDLPRFGRWVLTENRKVLCMTVLGLLIFGTFQFFRPLTYYELINDKDFQRREFFDLWELRCVRCQQTSLFVIPTKGD